MSIDFAEGNHIVVVEEKEYDGRTYYRVGSNEQFRRTCLKILKDHFEWGAFKYFADCYSEPNQRELSDNLKLTDEEVEALPEHLRTPVVKEREQHDKNLESEKRIVRWVGLVKEAIDQDDDKNAWKLIYWAKNEGLASDHIDIRIEELDSVEAVSPDSVSA